MFLEFIVGRAIIVVGGEHEAINILVDVFICFSECGLVSSELLLFLFHFFFNFDNLFIFLFDFVLILDVVLLQLFYLFVQLLFSV